MAFPAFRLIRSRNLPDALAALSQHASEGARSTRVLAGGTDLLPSMRQRLFQPEYVLDLRLINELKGIRETEQGIEIGALTALSEIENSELLKRNCPVLVEAAKTVASPLIRNMSTIGGNVCLDTRCLWYNQSLAWRSPAVSVLKRTAISATSHLAARNAGLCFPLTRLPPFFAWMRKLKLPTRPVPGVSRFATSTPA